MWRRGQRYGRLAFWTLSEGVLRILGRRPPYAILKIELAGEIAEEPLEQRFLPFPQRGRGDYLDLIALLRWARDDPALQAVFVRCDGVRAGWAKIQEIHRSLTALRTAGKHVWVYLTHAGMHEYLLAAAADQVVLTPAGTLDVTGLSSEVTFVSGALEKLGIEAELIQMGKYKSAAETFTRTAMSEPHREMVDGLVHDLYEQLVDRIAAGRGLQPEAVRTLLDRGPFGAPAAVDAGLVDALLYEDQAEERLRALCNDAPSIERRDYALRRGRAVRRTVLRSGAPAIGLLHLTGTLKTGDSIPGPDAASACGARAVARDLKELRERSDIAAVLLRISSPGGSGLASDLIWREVERTRTRKPVVVSFGDVAASGGYYVGVAGSPVIAEDGTITGSIGVLAGKANLRGLYDHLGVTKEIVSRGRHAALYSDYVPLGDEERQLLRSEAERFYETFLDKVASGRHLARDAVAAAAQGRVWTGRQAQGLGLVDQIGGIERALDHAKRLAGLAADAPTAVERYPKPRRRWRISLGLLPPRSEVTAVFPWLRFLSGERIWAVLPWNFRFF
jgi:protease-4